MSEAPEAQTPEATSDVVTSVSGGILTVTLNRADKRNALTRAMYDALAAAFGQLDSDPALRCMVLTGAGDFFCAGNDIGDFMAHPPSGPESPVMRFLAALAARCKPVVAAVNGSAVGVGLTMLLHLDIVLVAEDVALTAPFARLALVPEAASSQLLVERIGHARAAEVFMLGRAITAGEAVAWGIANAAVPQGDLMARAEAAAAGIAALAPQAVRQTLELMRAPSEPVAARMAREGAIFMERLRTDEAREAFTAFMQKRQPDFSRFE